MLHIVLTLLKIIVFFLLTLLGIALLLVFMVLASPVSYEFSGGWDGKPHLKGRVYWLYRILRISVIMKNGQPEARISIFGRVMGSGEKAEHKEEKNGNTLKEEQAPLINEKNETVSEDVLEEREFFSEEDEAIPKEAGAASQEAEEFSEEDVFFREEDESLWDIESEPEEIPETGFVQGSTGETGSVLSVIRKVLDFINLPSVRLLLGKLRKGIGRIIRHLRPSDLRIRARIGTEDPSLTGRIMELAAVLYAFYGDHIEIAADFDKKVLEAVFSVKGRLIPGYLIVKILGMALRILLNRECRAFYREIKENLT
ncbi:MAG: DUF2953 domain-containing protein [Lachnospiraceae bacterium]|nr:DUF2953 domain-containing protein [Lachnospiraceae bacterium]